MIRATSLVIAAAIALCGLAGCSRTSERWEALRESWPDDRPTGGTPTEFLEYHDGREAFEEMLATRHEAEHEAESQHEAESEH